MESIFLAGINSPWLERHVGAAMIGLKDGT